MTELSEYHGVRNISIGYYEKLFRSFAGVSPTKYRNIHRINSIKTLLHDDRIILNTISENATAVTFAAFSSRKPG